MEGMKRTHSPQEDVDFWSMRLERHAQMVASSACRTRPSVSGVGVSNWFQRIDFQTALLIVTIRHECDLLDKLQTACGVV